MTAMRERETEKREKPHQSCPRPFERDEMKFIQKDSGREGREI